jgi:hypothetical protein
MRHRTVASRIDVFAAGQDEAIDAIENPLCRREVSEGWGRQGDEPGALEGHDVGSVEPGTQRVANQLGGGGHCDERA